MAEKLNSNRIKFPIGGQRIFIGKCLEKLKLSNDRAAEIIDVSTRTLTDWKREKFLISLHAVKTLSKLSGIYIPANAKILDGLWHIKKASRIGGLAVYKKYGFVGGDPMHRKKLWSEWWQKSGRFLNNPMMKRAKIKIPERNGKLAEFVGIMIGDGGMTKHQITITLNSIDDYEYSVFVQNLIKNIFGVNPGISYRKNAKALDIKVSRTNLVDFCRKIGLKVGDKIKQGLDVPVWIKNSRSFQKSCMRGLMDTDGCVVIHKYKVNKKQYCYKKIAFCSASKPLIKSVLGILKKFDFNPRLSHNGRNVWIDDQKEVKRYFQVIKSSNPKHEERLLR